MRNHVDFIVAGPPRSGTTYVFKNLALHPEVFMASSKGEHSTGDIHFFDVERSEGDENFNKGLGWYFENFDPADKGQFKGEKTADYFADSRAPFLIKKMLGNVKIIVVLRDPVERAYSHYWHERPNLGGMSFDDVVAQGKDVGDARIISSGFYATNLQRYFSVFRRDMVHVIVFDDIKRNPEPVLGTLCGFLGISRAVEFPLMHSQVNRGGGSAVIDFLRSTAFRLKRRFPALYCILLDSWLGRRAKSLLARKRQLAVSDGRGTSKGAVYRYPPMSEYAKSRLRGLYQCEVECVSEMLNRDLKSLWWSDEKG